MEPEIEPADADLEPADDELELEELEELELEELELERDGAETAALLAGLDPAAAENAEGVLQWLLPEGDHPRHLTQEMVQTFLWYELPRKWSATSAEQHEIAWSLGDLLTAAGLTRYAGLCRDPATHRVIEAWDRSEDEGFAAFRAALDASGIDPPDTPVLPWGSVMGLEEHVARTAAGLALERAVEAGDLVPGSRGSRQRAVRLVECYLTTPYVGFDGAVPLEVVRRERAGRWAAGPPEARKDVLAPVLPLLDSEAPVPAEVGESLVPLVWLLERVGDGVTFTQAGWLPKALVLEANERFRWFDLPGFTVRTETDLHQLADLHVLARRTRLLTKRGRKLTVSGFGREALADPERLWRVVAADPFTGKDLRAEASALAAAVLLRADRPMLRSELEGRVTAAVQGRWMVQGGGPVDEWSVSRALRDYLVVGEVLGWVVEAGEWGARTVGLTPLGRAGAVLGLQAQSWAPRHRP